MSEKKERQPNELTLKAMEDAENGIGMSRPFNSVPELMEALNADDADEPNAETLAAFTEGERMLHDPAAPRFSSVDGLFDDLDGEAGTLAAIGEVQQMKQNPSIGKTYTDIDGMMKELLE